MSVWTILIMGATGDLARSRLLPTLYHMMVRDPDTSFVLIGAAKDDTTIDHLLTSSIKDADRTILKALIARSTYQQVDFAQPASFAHLAKVVLQVTQAYGSHNLLVYMSISSHWYVEVTKQLVEHHILMRSPAHKVVYEKPFGWDASSAKEIDTAITSYLDDDQIYRVDHYLNKSLVSSLLLTRFSNVFFGPTWNAHYIDQVHIILSETETLSGRGAFYDHYGALKDVVQNHMLQLLASVAMEQPNSLEPACLSSAKSTVLKRTRFTDGLLGQYSGYHAASGISPDSTTETYALLRAEVHTSRWTGVPFYLRTGKALHEKTTEIHIVYKPQTMTLTKATPCEANRLTLRISPESSILLRLNTQRSRQEAIVPISMEYCYRCTFGADQPHSYETLFLDIMQGTPSSSVTLEEITNAWHCIDQLKKLALPIYPYDKGSAGPEQAKAFSDKYHILWSSPSVTAQSTRE